MSDVKILSGSEIAAAARVLSQGGLLGFPTETVYGLAANADDEVAVTRIFEAKGRPKNHPLIVHIADVSQMNGWAVDVPQYAQTLAQRFWPGPLTLILSRSDRAKDFVTGGHPTVGLRIPNNPIGLAVLREFGGAVAAPSANRFGEVSPTSAEHVRAGLSAFLSSSTDAIIDGGDSQVGLESTIVDCTRSNPRVLRPGAITAADIAEATGLDVIAAGGEVAAPGTLAAHYAPHARVHLVNDLSSVTAGAGLMADAAIATPTGVVRISSPVDAVDFGRDLYAALRRADDLGLADVYVIAPNGDGIEIAIKDRLQKAAVGSGGTQ